MEVEKNDDIIIDFNLDNNNSKTGSKNFKESKESKSSTSLNEPFPKELLTIEELKKICYEESQENSDDLNKKNFI